MAFKVNGQIFQVLEPDADIVLEIDNSDGPTENAQIRFTDVTQEEPAGRFRWMVEGDSLSLQRATALDWAEWVTLLQVDGTTLELDLPDDDVGEALISLLVEVQDLRAKIELLTA